MCFKMGKYQRLQSPKAWQNPQLQTLFGLGVTHAIIKCFVSGNCDESGIQNIRVNCCFHPVKDCYIYEANNQKYQTIMEVYSSLLILQYILFVFSFSNALVVVLFEHMITVNYSHSFWISFQALPKLGFLCMPIQCCYGIFIISLLCCKFQCSKCFLSQILSRLWERFRCGELLLIKSRFLNLTAAALTKNATIPQRSYKIFLMGEMKNAFKVKI